jgi:hypothetical protein
MEKIVSSGAFEALLSAALPTKISPWLGSRRERRKLTTDGVKFSPALVGKILGSLVPGRQYAAQELVVPKSIPMTAIVIPPLI